MTKRGQAFVLSAVGLTLLCSGCTGCHRDAPIGTSPTPRSPSKQDLLEFQRMRALSIDSLIADHTAHWTEGQITGTGIRWEILSRAPQSPAVSSLAEGTVLELHHRIALLDGQVISDWTSDGAMAFESGKTDLPSGFHELIGLAHLGDSIRAILPPIRAWGMSGLPPDIPQEAVIDFTFRVDLYTRPS